ncbi:hypothetical protein CDIK_3546 [Cucumispora dikerogammari]|nr:hypothetical protein CDIK_3546 [Cucumispora dikerogammari]
MSDSPSGLKETQTRRTRATLTAREKERIISLHHQDHRLASISRITGLNYRTAVQADIRKYNNTRKISTGQRGRQSGDRLLTEEVMRFVENEIRLECTLTLKTIQTRIHNTFNIKPCLETIRRSLLDISITLKRLNCVFEDVNSPRSKELRFEYANYFLNDLTLEDKFLIFIDESPFKIYIRRNYGRSPAETRATRIVLTNRERNLSLISAINGESVLYSVVID